MSGVKYLQRVEQRACRLLDTHRPDLPVGLTTYAKFVGKHCTRIVVRFEPAEHIGSQWHLQEWFIEMCKRLNSEFENDRLYAGIFLDVPHELLGEIGLSMSFKKDQPQMLTRDGWLGETEN